MSAVELRIDAPADGEAFSGVPDVTFRGAVTGLPAELEGVPLYYRWYSSLFSGDVDKPQYSMNENAFTDPAAPFSRALGMGTHAIAFAASDQVGETAAEFEAIRHGGVTGGSAGPGRCLVHVFKANCLEPSPPTTSGRYAELSRGAGILTAEAPSLWAVDLKPKDGKEEYLPNPDYLAINRLRYRWQLSPEGEPEGREVVTFTPAPEDMTFRPADDKGPARVSYPADLSAQVGRRYVVYGSYTLTLFVEDQQGVFEGDRQSFLVEVVS